MLRKSQYPFVQLVKQVLQLSLKLVTMVAIVLMTMINSIIVVITVIITIATTAIFLKQAKPAITHAMFILI
jgi:hypothetical protein